MHILVAAVLAAAVVLGSARPAQAFETDAFQTSRGPLSITFLGHSSLLFGFEGKTVYVDPIGKVADFSTLPKADLILVTHQHRDHLDLENLSKVRRPDTVVLANPLGAEIIPGSLAVRNGEFTEALGLPIAVVPAYNIKHFRPEGMPYHPKGEGNGYVITFGGLKVYVAGDTENVPEMRALKGVDVAFLPMNLPFTMTPEMAADAARMVRPRVLYPYHTGDTDTARIVELLKGEPGVEVRIRSLR